METISVYDLQLWEAFVWTARKGQFTAAGRVLGISTAQVSKRIQFLESLLHRRLFSRTTRKVTLTHDGGMALPLAETLLEQAQLLEKRMPSLQEVVGTVKVACLPSFATRCLGPTLMDFRKRHPGIEVTLDVSESIVDLVENRIDVALRIQDPEGAQSVFRKILENKLVLVAAPSYLKSLGARAIPKDPSDLKHHPMLTLGVFEELAFQNGPRLQSLGLSQPVKCESGSMTTELCLAGLGIAVRSAWDVGPLVREGRLVPLLPNWPLESFGWLYAVTPHRTLIPQRVRAFLDHVAHVSHAWKKGSDAAFKTRGSGGGPRTR